jgi:hypothetical protein
MRAPVLVALAALWVAGSLAGCSSSPEPEAAATPPAAEADQAQPPPPMPHPSSATGEGFTRIVVGSGDSVSALPGTAGALYKYHFRMTQPAGERFTYQDRDLSFYFRPGPASIYFQVENRQNRPVTIDWDRSVFYGPTGQQSTLAHSTTRWEDRYSTQSPTIVSGLQRYGDYVFGVSYLVDPAGSGQQLHRAMFPEDEQASQFTGRSYGMDLMFLIDDKPRPYAVRFRVESVIPQ